MPEPTTPATNAEPVVNTTVVPTPDAVVGDSLLGKVNEKEVDTKDSDPLFNPLIADGELINDKDNNVIVNEEIKVEDIVIPEGMTLDTEVLEQFLPIAKELNLNKEQAQKLVDFQLSTIKNTEQQGQDNFNKVVKELEQETKDMLGADYKKELSYAAKTMNLLNEEDRKSLKEVLNNSGMGNHPLLIKMFIEAGKSLSEDKLVDGKAVNTAKSRMYTNSNMEI